MSLTGFARHGASVRAAVPRPPSHTMGTARRPSAPFGLGAASRTRHPSDDREKLQGRLTKLVGGVAIIKEVGVATETEMKDTKACVEDAMHATKAAVEKMWSRGEAVVAVLADLRIDRIARTCLLGREGRSAAARRLGIRVLDGEAAAGDGVDEVDLGVLQILDGDRVDEQLDAVGLEDLIARSLAISSIIRPY